MKSVLISIRPQWCELIANGEKTIEVRKSRPKLETPFKCYIYQTKPKDKLITILKDGDENYGETYHGKPVFIKTYGNGYWTGKNQKVIGEFVCDKVFYIAHPIFPHAPLVFEEMGTLNRPNVIQETCLTEIEIDNYLNDENGYGWHISALQIYDKPRELGEFSRFGFFGMGNSKIVCGNRACEHFVESTDYDEPPECNIGDCVLAHPPQSWCYVEELT